MSSSPAPGTIDHTLTIIVASPLQRSTLATLWIPIGEQQCMLTFWIVCGFTQHLGIDFFEAFSPIVKRPPFTSFSKLLHLVDGPCINSRSRMGSFMGSWKTCSLSAFHRLCQCSSSNQHMPSCPVPVLAQILASPPAARTLATKWDGMFIRKGTSRAFWY